MRVWIDQDLCVGNGLCEELCPEMFRLADGDVAYVLDRGTLLAEGPDGTVDVPVSLEELVVDAAAQCPAECIYIEP